MGFEQGFDQKSDPTVLGIYPGFEKRKVIRYSPWLQMTGTLTSDPGKMFDSEFMFCPHQGSLSEHLMLISSIFNKISRLLNFPGKLSEFSCLLFSHTNSLFKNVFGQNVLFVNLY